MNDKFRFLTIGYIESRKGQDILVEAVKALKETVRNECQFLMVGQDTSLLAQDLKECTASILEIQMIGTVDRKGIHRLLKTVDVLIVPSREDPMPTVAAEAMMHSVPCIMSDAAGTAGYLTDGMDGWIFERENALELSQKIEWCFHHREDVKQAGRHARKLYEKVFSMDVFEKNLLTLINELNE